jgi:hypothetical protein
MRHWLWLRRCEMRRHLHYEPPWGRVQGVLGRGPRRLLQVPRYLGLHLHNGVSMPCHRESRAQRVAHDLRDSSRFGGESEVLGGRSLM